MSRPPFTDPNSGEKFDTTSPNFEGWLTKQSVWMKDWRRRNVLNMYVCWMGVG